MSEPLPEADLSTRTWKRRYATSSLDPTGKSGDLLRSFYVPALLRTVTYDRVAGYFRSSALAAASRGFSAIAQRGGKVRLIAGCDLAPHDVQAILDGNVAKLEQHLGKELDQLTSEPEEVRTGVQLLSHLITKGLLDIQVAFRRHALTGLPITLTDSADGYVHEKWGIFTDAFGNRLTFDGSMNESTTALMMNAENIGTMMSWSGPSDSESIQEMCEAFEAMWENRHPNFVVRAIPEAILERLLEIGEGMEFPVELDGKPALIERRAKPSPIDWLRFAVIKNAPKMVGGETVGIYTAPIKPWPHQEIVARRLVDTYPYGYMLCDEVGLGKTIETGLAFRALWLSGHAKRILISPPASLVSQWQREMATKFLMPFGIGRSKGKGARISFEMPSKYDDDRSSLYDHDLLIVSTGLLQRNERLEQLKKAEAFDIALVDEAHFARRSGSTAGLDEEPSFGKLYKAFDDGLRHKARALWLATATPMQLNAVEAYDLADLIGRLGCFASEQSLVGIYYTLLGKLAQGIALTSDEQQTLHIIASRTQFEDPALWEKIRNWLIEKDPQLEVIYTQWIETEYWPGRREEQKLLMRVLFAISPLHRVMLRHTRSLLEQYRKYNLLTERLAKRTVRPIPRELVFRQDERAAYAELEQYCVDLQATIGSHISGQLKSSLGFYLSLLQQRFASSAVAIRNTMQRRLQRVQEAIAALERYGVDETDQLEELRETLTEEEWEGEEDELEQVIKATLRGRTRGDLEWEEQRLTELLPTYVNLAQVRSTKTDLLLRVMSDRVRPDDSTRYRQTVLFTRYADTLDHLVETFRGAAPGMRLGTFSGEGGRYWDVIHREWKHVKKNRDEIKHRFLNGEIDLLLCTDAAAEGLNLQSADLLINYDLPWNPMKVEQRIGRIDRIGQRFDNIEVLNLATVGSVEEIIYGRLWDRLRVAASVVGSQQFSILPILEQDFVDLASGKITHDQLEQKALRELEEHNREIRQLEIPPEDLYQIFNKELRSYRLETRVITLEEIEFALSESDYLKATGCTVHETDGHKWLEIRGASSWGGLYTRFALTASQALYERGVGDESLPVKFASYGEPGFDELLDEFTNDKYRPPGVVVVAEQLELDERVWEKTAVLAMVREPGGAVAAYRVSSFSELKSLTLALEVVVPEEAIEQCKLWLREQIVNQRHRFRERCSMLARHKEIGDANKAFMYMLANGMIQSAQRRTTVKDPDKPNQVIAAAQEMAEEDRQIIYDIHIDQMPQTQKRDLIVKLGSEHYNNQWRSTPHFRQAAMHIIRRERALLRTRGDNEVTTTQLLNNLWRKAEGLLK
jgi:ERCC4-related helicase